MMPSDNSSPRSESFPEKKDVFIHDLKNIMTGALGHLSLARRRAGENSSVAESLFAVESILRGACSMAEGALGTPEEDIPRNLSVLDAISACIGICVPPAGFTLKITHGENLPLVCVSSNPLRQLFNNLLTNSVEAMGEKGNIRVHLEEELLYRREDDGRVLQVTVSDNGPGIPGDIADRIFDHGFTSREKGSGLGLASARAWLEGIGGSIELDRSISQGAAFLICLPGIGENDPRTHPVKSISHGSAGRALVMDDDPMVLGIVEEMLEHLGWSVITKEEGGDTIREYEQALKSEDPFGLVILDLNVPRGWGGEITAKKIRSLDPQARIFISSGQESGAVMNDPPAFGFEGSLKKPYSLEELSQIAGK